MDIGPLEYVVIGLQDHHFTSEILPELGTIQEQKENPVANLASADVSDATMIGAYLRYANLNGARLTAEQLEQTQEGAFFS